MSIHQPENYVKETAIPYISKLLFGGVSHPQIVSKCQPPIT